MFPQAEFRLPGDILKAVIVTLISLALWRAYPRAFGTVASSVTPTINEAPVSADR